MGREKRQSYRDRYFADNEAVKVAANNRKGYRTIYRYVGLWKSWESAGGSLKRQKALIGLIELAGLCLYLSCAMADAPVNRSHMASGLGALSIIPWLLELSGVVRFLLAKEYVRDLSMDEIDGSIRYGCCLHAGLVILSGLAGMAGCLSSGDAGLRDALLLAGILMSAALSLVIWRLYRKLLINTYRNVNGNPGSRI